MKTRTVTREVYTVYESKRRSHKEKEFTELDRAVSFAEQCMLLGGTDYCVMHEIYVEGRKSAHHRCCAYNTCWPDDRKPRKCVKTLPF